MSQQTIETDIYRERGMRVDLKEEREVRRGGREKKKKEQSRAK